MITDPHKDISNIEGKDADNDLIRKICSDIPELLYSDKDKLRCAIGAINDCLEMMPTGMEILKLIGQPNISSRDLQIYILATWKFWFSFHVVTDILKQNENAPFLNEEQERTAIAVHGLLRKFAGDIMSSLSGTIDFNHRSELYNISEINGHKLKSPFLGNLDSDGDGFIAKCFEVPQVYGHGDTREEARNNLFAELGTLYTDLAKDDNFSEEFLLVKELFNVAVSNEKRAI